MLACVRRAVPALAGAVARIGGVRAMSLALSPAELAEQYTEDGYVVVDGLLSKAEVRKTLAWSDKKKEETRKNGNKSEVKRGKAGKRGEERKTREGSRDKIKRRKETTERQKKAMERAITVGERKRKGARKAEAMTMLLAPIQMTFLHVKVSERDTRPKPKEWRGEEHRHPVAGKLSFRYAFLDPFQLGELQQELVAICRGQRGELPGANPEAASLPSDDGEPGRRCRGFE